NISGYHNVAVGFSAFPLETDFHNSIALGYLTRVHASYQARIGNIDVTSIGGYANWTNVSDGRFKTDVNENVPGMALVKRLRPVTYRLDMNALAKWNQIPDSLRDKHSEAAKAAEVQIGFIAQEVEQAANQIGFDFHAVDKPKNANDAYGLRYAEFVPVLVKALQEQQEILRRQEEKIRALEARLRQLENQRQP
ncbi:MAG: hypothetical protein GXO24_00640, partial [Chlorobi bacterium]|nr:hypothetical protein [Chlorobiota bacterium]